MPRASVVFRTSMGGFCRVSKEGEKEEEVAGSGREVAPRVSKGVFLEVGRGAEIGVVGRWLFTVGRVSRVCVQGRGPAQRYIARVCSRVGARATARTGCGQSTRGVRVRTCVGRGGPCDRKGRVETPGRRGRGRRSCPHGRRNIQHGPKAMSN